VFERFTDRARRVVVLAQEEARMLNHDYIGTEHILLGLIHEGDGVAARAIESLNISLADVRRQIEEIIGKGQTSPTGHIPFTPRAKKVLEFSLREALELGHNYIGTEHILLGLVREGEGVAAQVLERFGVTMDRVRRTVIELLSGYAGATAVAAVAAGGTAETAELMSQVVPGDVSASAESFPTCPTCRSPLAETIAAKSLDLAVGDEPSTVTLAYCSRCGTALGTIR
jgi:ATP-dependent Clp protease ATP-binding subunit ClpC